MWLVNSMSLMLLTGWLLLKALPGWLRRLERLWWFFPGPPAPICIDNAARLADEVVEWCSQISMFPREFCVPEPELVELALFAPLRPGVVPGFVAQNRVVAQRLERHLGTLDNLERTWTQVALLFPAVDALDELAAFIEWPLLRDLSRELRTVLDMQEFLLAWSEWSEGRVLV